MTEYCIYIYRQSDDSIVGKYKNRRKIHIYPVHTNIKIYSFFTRYIEFILYTKSTLTVAATVELFLFRYTCIENRKKYQQQS